MQIKFDKQDIIDAICVYVAAKANNGHVEGSSPHLVNDIELKYNNRGITAEAEIYNYDYDLNEQVVKEAIGLYLSAYYSFRADRLLINLSYNILNNHFGADIIVER
jgi:hypothetical protein